MFSSCQLSISAEKRNEAGEVPLGQGILCLQGQVTCYFGSLRASASVHPPHPPASKALFVSLPFSSTVRIEPLGPQTPLCPTEVGTSWASLPQGLWKLGRQPSEEGTWLMACEAWHRSHPWETGMKRSSGSSSVGRVVPVLWKPCWPCSWGSATFCLGRDEVRTVSCPCTALPHDHHRAKVGIWLWRKPRSFSEKDLGGVPS